MTTVEKMVAEMVKNAEEIRADNSLHKPHQISYSAMQIFLLSWEFFMGLKSYLIRHFLGTGRTV